MTNRNTTSLALGFGLLVALAITACVTPPSGGLDTPLTQGDVTVTVTGVELAYLDLEGPRGGVQTDAPILAIRMTVRNGGIEPVRYDLGWGASAATQAQTALLFVAPAAEAEPTSGAPVPRALLNTMRYLGDPVTEAMNIAPGEQIEDVLLFSRPPSGTTSLLLSVPPVVFGPETKVPAYVTIPFADPGEVAAPASLPLGTAFSTADSSFTVTGVAVDWARLNNSNVQREGFSERPLLRVDFTVANLGESTIEWIPTTANNTIQPPTMTTADGATVPRATFPSAVTAVGFQQERRQIGGGESFSAFLLFERPSADVSSLRLVVPGARFGTTGLARFELPFTYADPPQPAELTPRTVEAVPE